MNHDRLFSTFSPAQQTLFIKYAEAYGGAYTEGNKNPDPRLSALPHHKRIALHDAVALEARFVETFAPAVIEEAKRPGSTRHDIANTMLREYPLLAESVYQGKFDVLCDISLRLVNYPPLPLTRQVGACEGESLNKSG